MKDSIKNRKKNFLALCLSVMMLSSVAAFAACGSNGSDSSSTDSSSSSASTSAEKDTGLIKNANFKTYDEDNLLNTSVTGWTRSTNSSSSGTALTSKTASGILDLSEDAWKDLTGSYYDDPDTVTTLTEAQAEAVWDKLTVRDKLAYYDQWKEDNSGDTISKELDFYESFNIDSEDIPDIERFKTHHADTDENKDDRVLMIHNEYETTSTSLKYEALGTAQKFTSSSTVTVKAGTSAQFSVWVKTQDLQCSSSLGQAQEAVGKGAYISVTHSVGGTSLDAYKIENINTEHMSGLEGTNGWKQYSFLLKGSSYADTTFSLELGLGQGGGTYRGEYVNGYAFFDDIECKIVENTVYNDTFSDWGLTVSDEVGFADEGEDKVVDVSKVDKDKFAMNFYGGFTASADILTFANGVTQVATPTTTEVGGNTYSSSALNAPAPWINDGKGFNPANDIHEVFDNFAAIQTKASGLGADSYLSKVYENHFAGTTFANDQKTLLIMSADGVAYTADSTKEFSFAGTDGYLAISFFVKTSDLVGATGAGVTLIDGNDKTSFAAIDTTSITPVEIGDDDDYYDGWQQCFFFVEKGEDAADDVKFKLSFTYGPTSVEEATAATSYYQGFAAFTKFEVRPMTQKEFESAQGGTYAKVVTVTGGAKDTTTSGKGFDTEKGFNDIKTGLAQLQNYRGVYSDNALITGSFTGETEDSVYENAGLLNKEYFTEENGYFTTSTETWLNGIKTLAQGKTTATEVWNHVFGKDCTQPLLIWNDGTWGNKSYGYIGSPTTIAANTYTAVSVRVKTNAKASIYLVDMDKDNYEGGNPSAFNKYLSVGRQLTYWYDDEGNICTGDPSKASSSIAFKLQSNGLYKANKNNKDFYNKLNEAEQNAYYANLNAYTEKDENGNLLVAENGAKHDYSAYWNNEGVQRVAYYYNPLNGKYYADKALTVLVHNLTEIAKKQVDGKAVLETRFSALSADAYQLATTVNDTNGKWKTVTFYIHTGDVAKNYRLEIWNGTREGDNTATAGDYVIVDAYDPGTAESNFTSLLEQYEEEISETDTANRFDSVFSYYDTANHRRYNAELDENDIGNLYLDNYTPSANETGIAYLKYDQADDCTIFADYQYSEKTVTASEVEDDTEEEDDDTDTSDTDTNPWLLASSLAIAGVLLLAIASIVIRKVMVKMRKKRAAQGSVAKPKKDKKSKK